MMTLLPLLGACLAPETVAEAPEDLEPLGAPRSVDWPADDQETINLAHEEQAEFSYAEGRGVVLADVETVYGCLQEDMVNVNRREAASWEVVEEEPPDGVERAYSIPTLVENLLPVEYTDYWLHGLVGDEGRSRYRMIFGNDFMSYKEGSIVLTATPDGGGARLELIGRLEATARGSDTVAQYLGDVYADAVACAHGEPWPTFGD